MNPTIQALRAVTGVYYRRILYPVVGIGAIIILALYALVVWLATTVSPILWLLLIILIPLTIVAGAITAGLFVASRAIMPRNLTRAERQTITGFGNSLFGLLERGRVPYPLVLVMIGKDVLRRRESTFLKEVINDTSSLKSDFSRIRDMFA